MRTTLYIEKLSKKRHQIYMLLTVLLALLGYAYFLLFPLSFIASLYFLVDFILGIGSTQDWMWVGLASFIAATCAYVCFAALQITFPQVQGLKLTRNVTPALYDVIEEVQSHYKRPLIHNVVITDEYEIRLDAIPRIGVPVLFSNTLVIGLPLLQMLAPDEFRCELARCIGQHSGIIPRISLFISRSRSLWRVYSYSLRKQTKPSMRPLRWFFVPYSRLLDLVSIPAIRQEELNADSCAMDFMNEQVVLDTLKSESIGRAFLELHYWTSVRGMALRDPKTEMRPFAKLEKVLQSISTMESRKKWLGYAYDADQHPGDTIPVLKERMEGIGHIKICSVPVSDTTAAEEYLGKNKNKVVSIIDKLWRSTTFTRWLLEYKAQRRNLEKVRKLSRKSRRCILWPGDVLRYALLARKINGSPLSSSIRKLLKRNIKHLLPSFLVSKVHPQAEAGDLFR